MNVMLFEDRGAAAYYVEEWLRKEGHNVLSAFNPNDARSLWKERDKTAIHCIVLDLHTPPDGLTDAQKARTEGGLLSGWVWLKDEVLAQADWMRERVVVYSDYIPTLRACVSDEDLRRVTVIPKRQRSSAARDVIARIRAIAAIPFPGDTA